MEFVDPSDHSQNKERFHCLPLLTMLRYASNRLTRLSVVSLPTHVYTTITSSRTTSLHFAHRRPPLSYSFSRQLSSKARPTKSLEVTNTKSSVQLKPSPIGTIQKAPIAEPPLPPLHEDGVPGLRIKDFKSLFVQEENMGRKIYPLRWDWHLRMLLISCTPAFLIWILTLFVDYFLATDPEVVELFRDFRDVDKEINEAPKIMELARQTLEDRIVGLENQIATMKEALDDELYNEQHSRKRNEQSSEGEPVDLTSEDAQSRVSRARRLSLGMSRTGLT